MNEEINGTAAGYSSSDEPSIDSILPDAEAAVEKDVEEPVHAELTKIEKFFDTFKLDTEQDVEIAKGWIKMQVAKVRGLV